MRRTYIANHQPYHFFIWPFVRPSCFLSPTTCHPHSALRTTHTTCMYYRYIEPSTVRMHGKTDCMTWEMKLDIYSFVNHKVKGEGGGQKKNQLTNNIKAVFFCSRNNLKINFPKWNMKYEMENRKMNRKEENCSLIFFTIVYVPEMFSPVRCLIFSTAEVKE